ncbi:hypothetical protein H2203_008611 [Taxawa tesnikishii (nom. ined.)]|nr:hypothetical protein H2203_008611 [Dothideales sp. JES 119]
MSYADSVVLLIIFNGIGIPFRVLTGYISDRYLGVLNTFIPLLVFNTLLAYCWMAVKDQLSLYVFTCFYGVAIASWQSLLPTSVASLTKDISKTGSRFGMAFTVMGFAALIGPPLAGALISAQAGRYVGAQAWAGTSSAVGVCLVVGARVYRYGWRLMKC